MLNLSQPTLQPGRPVPDSEFEARRPSTEDFGRIGPGDPTPLSPAAGAAGWVHDALSGKALEV